MTRAKREAVKGGEGRRVVKRGRWGGAVKCSGCERRIALRFLRRAVDRVKRDRAFALAVTDGDLGLAHKVELWRVVVAASYRSGKF